MEKLQRNGADVAVVVVDRIHHFGNAVPFGLGREGLDEEGDQDSGRHRHQDDPEPPGRGGSMEVGVVLEGEPAEEA